MKVRVSWLAAALLLASFTTILAATFGDSPGERAVAAWFDAFNSGSEAELGKVADAHFTTDVPREQRLQNWRRLRGDTGNLTPVRVIAGRAGEIVVTARDAQGGMASVSFRLRGEPSRITGIQIEPLEEGEEPDPDNSPLTEAQALARIVHLADSLAASDRFAGVVRIERKDRVALERAWGQADRERRTQNRVDTKFNLGSINKSFTRALIAKLAEQGKLSPDDKLSKHLPDFPRDKGDRITIQQIVDMKAGLGDFFGPKFIAMDKSKLRNQLDWFPMFVDDPLLYEPGAGQEYSNAGYVVLGAVAEAVTGRNYYDLVRELIYQPAGMTNTDSWGQDEKVPNRAVGYTRDAPGGRGGRAGGPLVSNRPYQPWRGSAAGGGYSTAHDLMRYLKALRASKILKPATAEQFFGASPNPDGTVKLGLGIAGGSPGVNGVLLSAGEWTLVVLANRDEPVAEKIVQKSREWLGRVASQ